MLQFSFHIETTEPRGKTQEVIDLVKKNGLLDPKFYFWSYIILYIFFEKCVFLGIVVKLFPFLKRKDVLQSFRVFFLVHEVLVCFSSLFLFIGFVVV